MRPNAYGSSTIGVKKSTVCTSASSSVSRTTAASSAVLASTSTRGSLVRGSPATIGRSCAAPILQPHPAPCDSEVRGTVIGLESCRSVPGGRAYTDEELDAAVQALAQPGRLEDAQRIVAARAPQLQRILNEALEDADWFGPTHQAEVLKAASVA